MRKRITVLAVAALLALVGVIGWQVLRPSDEPVYKGKRLTKWLVPHPYLELNSSTTGILTPEAEEALRQIGSNAVPTLLRMLRARGSALKVKLMGLVQSQHVIKVEYIPANIWNASALEGFKILGSDGQSAVPELIRIASDNFSATSTSCAILSLVKVGPAARQAVPYLAHWVTNSDKRLRFYSGMVLRDIDPEAAAKAGITNAP